LAFWFLRAERYKHKNHKAFASVRRRRRELEASQPRIARDKVSTTRKSGASTKS
jgi:hypothetical protein